MQSVVVECSPVWTVVADSVGGACALGKVRKRRSGRCGRKKCTGRGRLGVDVAVAMVVVLMLGGA